MKPRAANSDKSAPGKPFPKGKSGNPSGRPKKTVTWKQAEKELRDALPRILLMTKNDLHSLLASNPTGTEMLAAKYLMEHVPDAVNRMLGKTPNVLTGKDGAPLIPKPAAPVYPAMNFDGWKPEQIDEFIKATSQAGKQV